MQTVSEVMTRDVRFVVPQESLQRAAQMMDELNVGVLPVCEGDRLVGMVTDRDITVRAVAAGKAPQDAHVDEVMSSEVRWCFEDQALDDVMIQMADSQIRRVPVVSHDDQHRLIGIVALGDVATKTQDGGQKRDVEQTLESVSSPSSPAAGAQAQDSGGGVGTGMPKAGESGLGAAGAGGTDAGGKVDADEARRNYGVGGPDLTGGGLPRA